MKARLIAFVSLLFVAEVAASWWVWGRSPTDTLRVWYSGFWAFEAGRLYYWVLAFATVVSLWIVVWYALLRRARAIMSGLFAAVLGVGLEVASSVIYWQSPRSSDLRGLFQSIWSWNRVPQANDMGWPSFRIYLWAHIVPWALVLVIEVVLWVLLEWRARIATRSATGRAVEPRRL